MASPRHSRPVSADLRQVPAAPRARARAWGPVAALLVLALLALAWFDGGEEPLRPIGQPVELPEQAQ